MEAGDKRNNDDGKSSNRTLSVVKGIKRHPGKYSPCYYFIYDLIGEGEGDRKTAAAGAPWLYQCVRRGNKQDADIHTTPTASWEIIPAISSIGYQTALFKERTSTEVQE